MPDLKDTKYEKLAEVYTNTRRLKRKPLEHPVGSGLFLRLSDGLGQRLMACCQVVDAGLIFPQVFRAVSGTISVSNASELDVLCKAVILRELYIVNGHEDLERQIGAAQDVTEVAAIVDNRI